MAGQGRPTANQRLAAIVAFLLVIGVVAATIALSAQEFLRVITQFVLLFVLVCAAWMALTRPHPQRTIGFAIAAVAAIGFVVSIFSSEHHLLLSAAARAAAVVIAVWLGQYAVGASKRSLQAADVEGTPVPAATRGVLFMNLKSGGGKPETFHLVDECRSRGIEPVVLEPGEDWLARVREVAASGHDVLGMAGGDGSQAMVGSVAAELGLPMVVVPAGTRNHLALDLGLDRDDVVGALDAYGPAVERPMDLARMNGRVFVNNVSLGLYASIVSSPDYRDNKVDTTLQTLPEVLGKDTEPFDLRFVGPDGTERRGAHLIQISNNPYGTTARGRSSRPRLDTGELGIIALTITKSDGGGPAAIAAFGTGHPERYGGYEEWSAPTFEVGSGAAIDVGLDGESLSMDPPLRFEMSPGAVRVRLPTHAIGYSPGARSITWRESLGELWRVIRGRPSRFQG